MTTTMCAWGPTRTSRKSHSVPTCQKTGCFGQQEWNIPVRLDFLNDNLKASKITEVNISTSSNITATIAWIQEHCENSLVSLLPNSLVLFFLSWWLFSCFHYIDHSLFLHQQWELMTLQQISYDKENLPHRGSPGPVVSGIHHPANVTL